MSSLVSRVVAAMQTIAPLSYADHSWDNVGLLIDSPHPFPSLTRVGIALDISPGVIAECISNNVGVLVCYHPVVFPSLKRLTSQDPKQLSLLSAIRHGIAIYCPHTALDSCPGGINEWIATGLLGPCDMSFVDVKSQQGILARPTEAPPTLAAVVARMKLHFQTATVRAAMGVDHELETTRCNSMAICAGSGGSLLKSTAGAVDVAVSGEMDHHTVLAMAQKGTTVLLVEHGSSERGFLSAVLRARLVEVMGVDDSDVVMVQSDVDVIQYV